MRLARSVLVALLALALASIGVAHAAQISLEGTSRVSAQSPTRCDNAVATTTTGATSTSVTVSGIAAACAGRALTVHVYSTSSAPASAPVTVPAGGGSVTVTVPSYAPSTSHKTYVSIGGWPVPSTWSYTAPTPTTGCKVLNSSGVDTGKSCSINIGGSRAHDNGDGAAAGQRTGHFYLRFNVGSIANGERLVFTVDVRSISGLPSGWSTWNTPMRGFGLGNLTAEPGALCSELPFLTARAPSWASGGGEIYFQYFENRTGKSGLGCS